MKCPECGDSNAYMGFASIDCPNTSCRHYQGSPAQPAPPSAPVSPSPFSSAPSAPSAPATAPAQGSTGTATIATALALDITSQTPKRSSVEITFIARGDPGRPNKTVEFFWTLPNQANAVVCTLSSRNTYYVAGIDADGQTTYTTQWRCTLDGVQPNYNFVLSYRIH